MSDKQGLKPFSVAGGVERIRFFNGKGEGIQGGGYNTRPLFGMDIASALYGTDNSFGIAEEVVLNVQQAEQSAKDDEGKRATYFTNKYDHLQID